MKQPYVMPIEKIGKIAVFTVDGKYIRDKMDEAFTNWGVKEVFKYIPPDEIWIDKEEGPDEHKYYVDNALSLKKSIAKGMSYEKAREKADKIEEKERNKVNPKEKGTRTGVYKSLLRRGPGKPTIWVVHGDKVRKNLDIDFTEGGHGLVYDYVPKNEVWVDDDTDPAEQKNLLIHELHERTLMAGGAVYNKAHASASRLEQMTRDHPEETDGTYERCWRASVVVKKRNPKLFQKGIIE